MKITALVTLVVPGKDGNVEVPPGASTELPEADAKDLIARGFASAPAAAPEASANPAKGPADPLASILDGTIPEITAKLEGLALEDLQRLRALEEGGKTRKGVIEAIDQAVKDLAEEDDDAEDEAQDGAPPADAK